MLLSDSLAWRTQDSKHLRQSFQIYRSSPLCRMLPMEASPPGSAWTLVCWCKTNTLHTNLFRSLKDNKPSWFSLAQPQPESDFAFEQKLIKRKFSFLNVFWGWLMHLKQGDREFSLDASKILRAVLILDWKRRTLFPTNSRWKLDFWTRSLPGLQTCWPQQIGSAHAGNQ